MENTSCVLIDYSFPFFYGLLLSVIPLYSLVSSSLHTTFSPLLLSSSRPLLFSSHLTVTLTAIHLFKVWFDPNQKSSSLPSP